MNAIPITLRATQKEDHVHVTGVIECDGHLLLIAYHVHVTADTSVHETRLDDYHAKGLVWSEMRREYNAWTGTVEQLDGADIVVAFCEIQPHGPHDWRLIVIWDEVIGTATAHRTRTWRASHPGALPSLVVAQDAVRTEVEVRAIRHSGGEAHAARVASIISV